MPGDTATKAGRTTRIDRRTLRAKNTRSVHRPQRHCNTTKTNCRLH